MKKAIKILEDAYKAQAKAEEKLREIYDCGKDLTENQRNRLLNAINGQKQAALNIFEVVKSLKAE